MQYYIYVVEQLSKKFENKMRIVTVLDRSVIVNNDIQITYIDTP